MSSSGSSSSELYQRQPLLPNGSAYSHMNGSAGGADHHLLHNHLHPHHHHAATGNHVEGRGTWIDTDSEESELTRILVDPNNDEDPLDAPQTRLSPHGADVFRSGNRDPEAGGLFSSHKPSDYSPGRSHRDATKVDLPPPTRDEYKFPKDRFKTFVAGIFFVFCGTVNMISLSIVHDRVPDREKGALPDVILDNIAVNDWALYVAEYLLMVLTYFCVLISIFHKHRWIVFRRCFFLLGVLYLYRSVTMFVTVLPVASKTYECNEKANATSTALVFHRTFELLLGLGLSVNGHHKYCGDYIYSGHTMILVLGALVVKEYTPRRLWPLHWVTMAWSFAGILMILYSRGHYTIDVILAYYITTRLFWMYHTFANNVLPKKSNNENNLLSRVWWFWFYAYLERNVSGPVPRVYQMPIPFMRMCRWLRYRNHRP